MELGQCPVAADLITSQEIYSLLQLQGRLLFAPKKLASKFWVPRSSLAKSLTRYGVIRRDDLHTPQYVMRQPGLGEHQLILL